MKVVYCTLFQQLYVQYLVFQLDSLSFPVLPSSQVVRRILRRGVIYGTEKLNAKPGMLASLVSTVVDSLVCDC